MQNTLTTSEIENNLHHLNYRWNLDALALWKGEKVPIETYRIYEGYGNFISLDTLAKIDTLKNGVAKQRLRHSLIDHYLQRALLPHEAEMRTWMKGASACVNDEKIFFRDIIPWCQKSSTYEARQILQKEASALCKFLKPFALNYWNLLLKIVREDLGFYNYLDYCQKKKEIDYAHFYEIIQNILFETDELYFSAMERWSKRRFNLPLSTLTRFDAIKLLSLEQFDPIFPDMTIEKLIAFFHYWHIDIENLPGLNLEVGKEREKSAQAICFILQAPEEVYVLMRPEGGWIDLETLWHELGHGLSAVFMSPQLSIVHRDMAPTFALSETFAFLFQKLAMSRPFLEDFLGLKREDSEEIYYHKVLRDLSLFRRYASKFIAEFDMFSNGNMSDGKPYSELMTRYTGFYYQPETHLFDLVPEFYSLEYLLGWMAETIMQDFFCSRRGDHWMFYRETGETLKNWWKQGNKYNIFDALSQNHLGRLTPDLLIKQWKTALS